MNARLLRALLALGLAAVAGACFSPQIPLFARAEVAPDFRTYQVRRVALLPVMGPRDADTARTDDLQALQDDLVGFLSSGTPYEIVELSEADLLGLSVDDPMRDARLSVDSLLGLADRFRVEAVLYVQVTREKIHPPLGLGLQSELVSVDTGQVLWRAAVQLDGASDPVRDAIRRFYRVDAGQPDGGDGWQVALVSPRRFARFAAWQLAQML